MTSTFDQLSFGDQSQAVLIGTSRYPNDDLLGDLPQVEENILTLSTLLQDPAVVGLDTAAIHRKINVEHSSALLSDLSKISKKTTDTLVVYYAGHGLYGDDASALYLATKNTSDEQKRHNGIRIEDVQDILRDSNAKRTILILDCCYSGAMFKSGMGGEAVRQSIDIEGTFALSAGPSTAKAIAIEGERYTVFSGALISVLEEGIENGSKLLTLNQISRDIKRRIKQVAGAPEPEQSSWLNANEFVFSSNQIGSDRSVFRVLSALEDTNKKLHTDQNVTREKFNKLNEDLSRSNKRILEVESRGGDLLEKAEFYFVVEDLKKSHEEWRECLTHIEAETKENMKDISKIFAQLSEVEELISVSGKHVILYRMRYFFYAIAIATVAIFLILTASLL